MAGSGVPRVTISEANLAKLREEMSSEELQLGLANIQELLVSMQATKHNRGVAKRLLGISDAELNKLDDDIDMDHGALYLKLEMTLQHDFKQTDTKNINRVMRYVSLVTVVAVYV